MACKDGRHGVGIAGKYYVVECEDCGLLEIYEIVRLGDAKSMWALKKVGELMPLTFEE